MRGSLGNKLVLLEEVILGLTWTYPKFVNIEARISNYSDLFDSDVMFLSRLLPQTVALTLSMLQKTRLAVTKTVTTILDFKIFGGGEIPHPYETLHKNVIRYLF